MMKKSWIKNLNLLVCNLKRCWKIPIISFCIYSRNYQNVAQGTVWNFYCYILDNGYHHLSNHTSKKSRSFYCTVSPESLLKSSFNKIFNHVLDFIESKIDNRDDLLSEYIAFEEGSATKKKERYYYGSRGVDLGDLFIIKIKSRYKDESLKVVSSFKVEKKLKYESTNSYQEIRWLRKTYTSDD